MQHLKGEESRNKIALQLRSSSKATLGSKETFEADGIALQPRVLIKV